MDSVLHVRLQWLRFVALAGLGLLVLAGAVNAQTRPVTLQTRMVEGRLVVMGYIARQDGVGVANDISLEVSLEDTGVLTLHRDMLDDFLGNTPVVKLLLRPEVELQIPLAEVTPEPRQDREALQNALFRRYSQLFDEQKLKGTLGLGFLRKYRVVMDAAAGTLTLFPPTGGAPPAGGVVQDFELRKGRIWVPVSYAGQPGHMVLGGGWYDTWIDSSTARALGKPAGNVSPIWLGGDKQFADLSAQFALRPRVFAGWLDDAHAGALLVSGNNFLESFRVEVDWQRSRIAFTRTNQPQYSQADFAFFEAQLQEGGDVMLKYLQRYPQTRLAPEAAQALMERRLQEPGATDDALVEAVQWVVDTTEPRRRMEMCLPYVKRINDLPARSVAAQRAGNLALQYSREAITVQDTYRLHNLVGEAYFKDAKFAQAWKHFLSAAFMPLADGQHNLAVQVNLARTYDRMGRVTRAYSRYLKCRELLAPRLEQGGREMQFLFVDVEAAIVRLKAQIPADELEVLDD